MSFGCICGLGFRWGFKLLALNGAVLALQRPQGGGGTLQGDPTLNLGTECQWSACGPQKNNSSSNTGMSAPAEIQQYGQKLFERKGCGCIKYLERHKEKEQLSTEVLFSWVTNCTSKFASFVLLVPYWWTIQCNALNFEAHKICRWSLSTKCWNGFSD